MMKSALPFKLGAKADSKNCRLCADESAES